MSRWWTSDLFIGLSMLVVIAVSVYWLLESLKVDPW